MIQVLLQPEIELRVAMPLRAAGAVDLVSQAAESPEFGKVISKFADRVAYERGARYSPFCPRAGR